MTKNPGVKKKILYILSHPIHYQSPLLKSLADQKEIDLKVFYLTSHTLGGIDKQFGEKIDWDTPLLDGYNYEFVKNYSMKPAVSGSFFGLINFGIIKKIRKENPDVVIIHGWAYFTNWVIFILSFLFKAKLWMRSESPLNQELLKRKFVLKFKVFILKNLVFRKCDKFLYIGKQNKDFYKFYKVPDKKLFFAPYAVDNLFYQNQYKENASGKENIRNELGLSSNAKVILTVGKYISKKRPLDVLTAYKNLQVKNKSLIMVGEGEIRGEMEDYIKKNNLKNVFLTGFVNASKISKYFIAADVFVLASHAGETWGLVTNEALNFGLPIVISDMSGSAYNLVEDAKNGFVFKTGRTDELTERMQRVLTDFEFAKQAKIWSFNIIKDYSYNVIVENILNNLS